ncbi:MAG: deoxyguanosinetriphosphate triphosphohydrolase, partial [Actinomyces sp.]
MSVQKSGFEPLRIDGNGGSGLSGYQPQDAERFVHEQAKNPQRTPFERDRARVLHSSALRR